MKKRVVQYLKRSELSRLNSHIKEPRDKLILDILYETGCTVNELINIRVKDIDFYKFKIKFSSSSTKSNKSRNGYISKNLIHKIKSYTQNSALNYLFSTRQSSQITTKRVRQLIQSYSIKTGLGKINPQVIRYTHIAHALERGISLTAIQKQVGMERLRIVQIYEALVPEEKEGEYKKFWVEEK